MNPVGKQNEINQQSRPWHERLVSALGSVWQGIVWWFTANEQEPIWLQQERARLERCWKLSAWEGKAQGND